MTHITIALGSLDQALEMVLVEGTCGRYYDFGDGDPPLAVAIEDFFISIVPVTQALWVHVMGHNPSIVPGDRRLAENISWDDITRAGGFLDTCNGGDVLQQAARTIPDAVDMSFRLPSETEWEYAARGGPHWAQRFRFSGSNEVDAVAWYKDNSGDSMHDVGQKAANQLGLFDMSGNVWEWCQDSLTRDIHRIPSDGSPYSGDSPERILRGGCFHNWAIHCTVSKRYEIGRQCHDGCIGFRLVLSKT
jgi:formylglycine-generating enzyme required for sulfatase activity